MKRAVRAGNYGFGYLVKVGSFNLLLLPLLALRAQAPVNHFGFVDLETVVSLGLEAGSVANRAANIFGVSARAAD